MNKLVKGSIAGAAGIALLLGGAGTFALWSDTQLLSGGTVQTGELDIALNGTAAWEDISPETSVANPFNPVTDKIVPGDVITYTQNVTVKASGKNIKASLAYTAGSIVIPAVLSGSATPGNPLDDYVTVSIGVTALVAADNGTITGTGPFTLTSASDGTVEYKVVITINFSSTTPGQVGQNAATGVDLTNAAFTLTQVRPS